MSFRDWKPATGKSGLLSKHNSSYMYAHRESVVAWNQYKSNTQHKNSIADQLGIVRAEQIDIAYYILVNILLHITSIGSALK